MPSRRTFIKNISIAATSGSLIATSAKAFTVPADKPNVTTGNIVLSTWSHGIPANEKAMELLNAKARAIDAAQQGVMVVEADPKNTSVGLSGYPDRDGIVTLDACLMDELGNAGSVCFLEGIDHPISVARLVMDKTPHVMLSGSGALQFAIQNGFKQKKGLSPDAKRAYTEWLKTSAYKPVINIENHDTIGLILRDERGNFSGACTTSGLAFKMHGRVGDSPIIGAGLFVDPEVGAATATGLGEAVIKICGSHLIVELMRMGQSPQRACEEAVKRISVKQKNFKDMQVGFLAINKAGEIGAFAIQPGFQYALAMNGKNELKDAASLLKAERK
ncbi:MAG: N(4)-(beta-N-acetylglucosaminyl)-L-asparaginase [Chitinophagaceae bacterium]|nr:N(4)-(beta-N-acetylglucosaminyl)-L-asparaginase [Chitinophagaceae bacterium]